MSRRRYAATIAVFAAVLFLALAIAASGIIGLLTDREVLAERDAGPLVAPAMFFVAACVLFLLLAGLGGREPTQRPSALPAAAIVGVIVYFFFLLSGSTLYSLGSGEPFLWLLFFGANALHPFAIAVGIIAIVVAFAALLLFDFRDRGGIRRTPRWPWERRDDSDEPD